MMSHTTNEKGFTLIETSIAMLVMMVVGLGATSLFLYAVRNNTGGAQRSLSMAIAQQRAEDLRGVDYDDAKLAFGVHEPETVVIEGTTPGSSTYYQSGASAYGQSAPVGARGFAAPGAPPAPTATPTPSASPGGTLPVAATTGSSFFQVQKRVDPFPAGAAAPTQKRITIRVTPRNGDGAASWMNQAPVEIVIRRSSTTPGPNRM